MEKIIVHLKEAFILKSKIALALAIIKLKPRNVTAEEFTKLLMIKIRQNYPFIINELKNVKNENLILRQNSVLALLQNFDKYLGETSANIQKDHLDIESNASANIQNALFVSKICILLSKNQLDQNGKSLYHFIDKDDLLNILNESVLKLFKSFEINEDVTDEENQQTTLALKFLISLCDQTVLDSSIREIILKRCLQFLEYLLDVYKTQSDVKTKKYLQGKISLFGDCEILGPTVLRLFLDYLNKCTSTLNFDEELDPCVFDTIYYLLECLKAAVSTFKVEDYPDLDLRLNVTLNNMKEFPLLFL